MSSSRLVRSTRLSASIPLLHPSRGLHATSSCLSQAKLVAEIRKRTQTSINKAREALAVTSNDVEAALEWLEKDLVASGAAKAAKVAGRVAGEGLVGVAILNDGRGSLQDVGFGPIRAAMVELNCETDFVARNDLFTKLVCDVAHTAAFLSEVAPLSASGSVLQQLPLEMLNDAPLLSHLPDSVPLQNSDVTVSSAIRDTIAKIGEKISLRRVTTFVTDPSLASYKDQMKSYTLGSFIHGGTKSGSAQAGKIGALVAMRLDSVALEAAYATKAITHPEFFDDMSKLSRSVARQVVGFETTSIRTPSSGSVEGITPGESTALYDQPFMMLAGGSSEKRVEDVLREWSVERGLGTVQGGQSAINVVDYAKWTAGEGIEQAQGGLGFAEEVKRLSNSA